MKKLAISAVVCAMAMLASAPGHAAADVTATILTPTPIGSTGQSGAIGDVECTDTADPNCEKGPVARAARCLYTASEGASQTEDTGVQGYVVRLEGTETSFTLEPQGDADFDVTFYVGLSVCESNAVTPGGKYTFSHFGNGPESGAVPEGSEYAIVTLFGGAAQAFHFTAS